MDIILWQERLVEELNKTFPKKVSTEHRLLALHRQVSEASQEFARESGGMDMNHHLEHSGYKHCLAAIFLDLFVLCEDAQVDIEVELEKAIKWLREHR